MEKLDPNKIPMPPVPDKVDLFLPLTFWSEILITLDKKIQTLTQDYGFGKVNLSVIVHAGKVKEILFNDEIRIRNLEERAAAMKNEKKDENLPKDSTT